MTSKRVAFVAHCLLNTNAAVAGTRIARAYPAMADEAVDFLQKNQVGIIQMPCPELGFFGPGRKPAGKEELGVLGYRKHCAKLAAGVAAQAKAYEKAGCRVLFALGQGRSPSCGVGQTYLTKKNVGKGSGIFIEELQKRLSVPFLCFDPKDIKGSIRRMEESL